VEREREKEKRVKGRKCKRRKGKKKEGGALPAPDFDSLSSPCNMVQP